MGFLDRILPGRSEYPELDAQSPVADRIANIREQLESLANRVHKPLEVIPDENGGFVFIGKPPKDFGVAWIEGDKLHTFKSLVEEQGVDPQDLTAIEKQLRQVYEANQQDPRYCTKIGRKNIVVTPSEQFRQQVNEVMRQAMH